MEDELDANISELLEVRNKLNSLRYTAEDEFGGEDGARKRGQYLKEIVAIDNLLDPLEDEIRILQNRRADGRHNEAWAEIRRLSHIIQRYGIKVLDT